MNDTDKIIDEFFDELKPNPFDPFIVIKEYVEWYPENAPAIQARGGHTTIAFTVELLAEIKRLREVMIYVEQRQPHPALEWALKEGLTLTEIKERIE